MLLMYQKSNPDDQVFLVSQKEKELSMVNAPSKVEKVLFLRCKKIKKIRLKTVFIYKLKVSLKELTLSRFKNIPVTPLPFLQYSLFIESCNQLALGVFQI